MTTFFHIVCGLGILVGFSAPTIHTILLLRDGRNDKIGHTASEKTQLSRANFLPTVELSDL